VRDRRLVGEHADLRRGAAGRRPSVARMLSAAVCAALVTTLSAAGAHAQQALTLADAVSLGLARHPSLGLVDALVARAAATADEASASLFPHAQADASLTRFQKPMVVAPLHGFNPQNPPLFDRTLAQGSVTLGYTAFDGGARSARTARAAALLGASESRRQAVRQEVIAEVVSRYATVATVRDLAAAHAARVAALEQERGRAARLLEQGRAARVVLLRAEAALSGGRAELAGTAAEVESAERELARLLGMDPGSVAALQVAAASLVLELPSRDEAVARAMTRNPDLSRLASQQAAAAAGESEARSQWWPRLHAGGRYVQYGSAAGDAGGEWQTGVQLSYSLFTGGSRSAAVQRARSESAAAAAEHALAALRIADAVDGALGRIAAARARAQAWATAVEQSTEVARIERLALDTGAGVQTDYLAAEAELLRARAALAEARYVELIAGIELMRSMGELDEGWVEANVESGR
jgi:outer membrane protein